MKIFGKILLSVFAAAIIGFAGFFCMVMAMFVPGATILQIALVPITAVIILLYTIASIWGLLKPKIRLLVFAGLISLVALTFAGSLILRAYDNSKEPVSAEVNLRLYEPFTEGTKAAALPEPSTLKITGDLPKLDGATALYPLYAAFVQAVYPEAEYNPYYSSTETAYVICSNTNYAYERLINGKADIIFAAEPSYEQIQMAQKMGVELKLTPIGREAFVFFVNSRNPVDGLTVDDIRKIYSGQATNWREFGGKNSSIRAFQRPQNSGSQTILERFMGDVPLMKPPVENVAGGMGEIINEVSEYRNYDNAIGYSFLYYASEMAADDRIKLLALNGIAPTRENVANNAYPYASEFYVVTAGSQNPNVGNFIEWILSEQGQYLVEKTGYTPLNAD